MSDELARALRELAAQHETPPRVGAAEVRTRAGRRSRRRRAAAALGAATAAACALTAVAFTLHTEDPGRNHRIPATASDTPSRSPATPVPVPPPSGRLDLGRHTLTVGDRVLRVDSHAFGRFPPGTRLTVTAKSELELLPLEGGAEAGHEVKVPYLVELRTPDGEPVYAGALTFDLRALAALPDEAGWLGMSLTDAEWFYARARTGDRIALTSTVLPGAGGATATPTRPPTETGTATGTSTTDGTGGGTPGTPEHTG
ncbi:hypothetical protein SUDANB15_05029 [Streptomyces sp. enrichment culture]|uniref:hypothetical protein n=1 Tax=Streptomyces sp. enrichment culture TaxID=1795815 RepID=UPI003F545050